nr:7376_t:CDS:10 [Entrophospora candida]
MIEIQLSKCSDCSVMFLVGGFSESKYLQSRIKQKFEDKLEIAIPPNPITAIVKGACEYGLNRKIVRTRVLLGSYGIKVDCKWQTGDPLSRKTINGRIYRFSLMARKGTEVNVNKEFSSYLGPINPNQTSGTLHFFYTTKYDATYCDEPEVKELGSFDVDMPDTHLGLNRSVEVTLHFGSMEIVATAKNRTTATDNDLCIKKAAEISNLSNNNERKKNESEGSNNELELERKKFELETSKATSTKLRQQIYGVLGNRGFSNIVVGKDKKHPLITTLQKDILDLMNCYLLPIGKFLNIKTSINTIMMNASWDEHDLEDLYVDICAFPIIGFNLCEADKVDKNLKTFSYAYIKPEKEKIEIAVNQEWGHFKSPYKLNTVLQYDEDYKEVVSWGADALRSEPSRRKRHTYKLLPRPVEDFKLHLENIPESQKPKLPPGITFDKAITDYLREMESTEYTKTIMRKCIYNAGLIKSIGALNLQFITEPEAIAIHCINMSKDFKLVTGAKYLVVDCGGRTVDLTIRKLLPDGQIGEVTEHSGDFCGGTYVDDEFLNFLESRVGKSAMNMLKKKHYSQVDYLIHKYFCPKIKIPFTGEKSKFKTIGLDIEKKYPALKQYVTGSERDQLSDEDEWVIDLDFDTVKSFFDPVINKILRLIEIQLSKYSDCSMMFLVGEFSESKYLQSRIKQRFGDRLKIAIPPNPATAIVRGACEYGLDMKIVSTKVLKWTYGIRLSHEWQAGDLSSRKTTDDQIYKFSFMARKETESDAGMEFSRNMVPIHPDQTSMRFTFFCTAEYSTTYCGESEMKELGSFVVDLPDTHLGLNRSVLLTLHFGSVEIVAIAKNRENGRIYQTTFKRLR